MNTNRNNNRRRGRGNNRGQSGGGQSNRIDNRARGNAPQMLEKYKKLAHDASLNDDRVQTEYYHQFADHYFRVIADSRVQKDDTRGRRDDRDDNSQDDDDGQDDRSRDNRNSDNRNSDDRNQNDRNQNDRGQTDRSQNDRNQNERSQSDRAKADTSEPRRTRSRNKADDDSGSGPAPAVRPRKGSEGDQIDASGEENPFTREAKPRKARAKPRRKADGEDDAKSGSASDGLDPGTLPPSIAVSSNDDAGDEDEKPASKSASTRRLSTAKPKTTRARRPRNADDGDSETLEAVS